ncbi:hypothetical protein Sjap_019789 [Stephania japonica]|uniref:P-type phospholipid transporter n=1 Tax=Stephania japonica TaxID=461633 RepID=A0AAP0EZF9_9MAGN
MLSPRGKIRGKLRLSNLYTFSCLRPSVLETEGPHTLRGPGFSRVVHCNQPDLKRAEKHPSNYISTTKYNVVTFLPTAIFEQFRRVANLYFLMAVVLSLTPVAPFSALFSALRFKWGMWLKWRRISFFPADLLLLSSSYEDGICYVETMNLDGETNLKVKRSLENTTNLYDPSSATLAGIFHLVTALILYGYLIPISLYVSIEVVKVLQASFINQDLNMFDGETWVPAAARTSNLNEELGQVDTILTDKTGTLTCNQMDFLKCSIGGVSYGVRAIEVEAAAREQMEHDLSGQDAVSSLFSVEKGVVNSDLETLKIELEAGVPHKVGKECKPAIKGFNFEDDQLMNGNWLKEKNPDAILLFFRILAICHTAIPEVNEVTGSFSYEAESPDEGAFLVCAGKEFKVLNLMEFNSKRKRMSVIIQDEEGKFFLLCKGADSIIFDRLSNDGKMYEEDTRKHLNEYGEAGLRTLALAYKRLEESEYLAWNDEFQKAKTTVGQNREALLEDISDVMENHLILVDFSVVPQCIDKLAQAGLKLWVLTGDKMETAINIGYACSLLRQDPKKNLSLQKEKGECGTNFTDFLITNQVAKENVMKQIKDASQMIKLEKDPHAAFALVIDGKTLSYALEDDMKHQFLSLAVDCASVICCRVSPKQKALAVMASDFSISQFRFLERLLVVHGHWCYKRIAQMVCYFFYKNIAFGLTLFYFEAYAGFSGQAVYDDWYMILFNVILTSLPVISLKFLTKMFLQRHGWSGNSHVHMHHLDCQLPNSSLNVPFHLIQHLLIWGSVVTWYIFLAIYGMLPFSGSAYRILTEALGPSIIYWSLTLLVVVACNAPYLTYIAFQRSTNPLDHHIIQEIKHYKKDVKDQHMWTRERSKARQQTKIGFTARVDEKIRQLRGRLQKKYSVLTVLPLRTVERQAKGREGAES